MGHSRYNNMKNLQQDCATGTIDAIVHMGDHCYDLGQADDRRGDAYMNALQPLLSVCPWVKHQSTLSPFTHCPSR